jgi:hypothetical protein
MARGRTGWDDDAEDILKDCRRAQHCIQLWQQEIEQHGEASREAKHAAMDLSNSLESLHWGNRRSRVMPVEWDSLSSASPDLAAALVELGGAAKAAGPITNAGWKKGTKPESWEWVERLSQAAAMLEEIVEPPPPKHRRTSSNDARDEFIYEEYLKGTNTAKIIELIKMNTTWYRLDSAAAIRRAVVRFAERRGYPPPRRGQRINHRLERG